MDTIHKYKKASVMVTPLNQCFQKRWQGSGVLKNMRTRWATLYAAHTQAGTGV
jgi:hypothetical protein